LFLKVKNLPAFGSGGADERVCKASALHKQEKVLNSHSFILVVLTKGEQTFLF